MGTPGFGVQGTGYPAAGEWGFSLGWRYQESDRHFVGDEYQEERDELGNQVINHVNLADLTVRYQATKRVELSLGVPIFMATRSQSLRQQGVELERYQTAARGVGDVFFTTRRWMFDPDTHPGGNLQLGVGVKIPTGQNNATDTFRVLSGSTVTNQIRTVDQSIQPGDGGFGILVDFTTFSAMAGGKMSVYGGGAYLATPGEKSNVQTYRTAPGEEVMSIADQYPGARRRGVPDSEEREHDVQRGPPRRGRAGAGHHWSGCRLSASRDRGVVRTRVQHHRQREERRHVVGSDRDLPESIPERAGQGERRARRRGVCRLSDSGGLLPPLLVSSEGLRPSDSPAPRSRAAPPAARWSASLRSLALGYGQRGSLPVD